MGNSLKQNTAGEKDQAFFFKRKKTKRKEPFNTKSGTWHLVFQQELRVWYFSFM